LSDDPLPRLRELCLGLPESWEKEAWGAPTFRVKTIFAMYSAPGHGEGDGRPSAWIKALAVNQALMVKADPTRFFVPPYVGPSGWVGVWLDGGESDWGVVRDLLWDAWQMSVPKKLGAQWEEPPPGW